ncbi:MmgE/PrpD family protein [Caballeronia sp. LjRoot31]|uniref:MmgE/PrpD family protein n=1 Tax=Caballeronia sp. LjRoot31 TaxID=3342324 RepID=UPI003ECDA43C
MYTERRIEPASADHQGSVDMSASHATQLTQLYDSWSGGSLTPSSRASARMGILDILGCIVAGSQTHTAATVRELAIEQGSAQQAAVFGTGVRLSVPLAALVNGVAGHVLDYDDMNATLIGHPSVVLVPAIMALGEARAMSGSAFLDAYVLGFEIAAHFARTMVPRHYDAGWHTTSSIGIFGAAAACSRVLGLDARGMLNALAIAASNVAGLRANFGSETKSLHAGQAAEGGVRAAMLAARGFTANVGLFDAPDGLFATYGANPVPKEAPLDEALEIDASGIGIKPYACCGAGISVIDVMLDLHEGGLPPVEDLLDIDCAVTSMATRIMPLQQAANGLEGKYCIAYCAAVAYLDGAGGLAQFDDARVQREDVQALMKRVNVRVAPHLASGAGRFGVELTIRRRDGTTLAAQVELPRGHPHRTLSSAALLRKFTDCATPVLGTERTTEVAGIVAALEDLADIRQLSALLQP